jgi:hypothetical protein
MNCGKLNNIKTKITYAFAEKYRPEMLGNFKKEINE